MHELHVNPLRCRDAEAYAISSIAESARTTHPSDLAKQALLLRSARTPFEKVRIRRIIIEQRAVWQAYLTTQQRKWQARVSRRPKRGNHHDSWAIREQYVRCHGSYHDYIGWSQTVRGGVRV